jgi:hypothetical protein
VLVVFPNWTAMMKVITQCGKRVIEETSPADKQKEKTVPQIDQEGTAKVESVARP